MAYPHLRKRDRGTGTGRLEIVFSEEQTWEEAQSFATQLLDRLGLTVTRRADGPDAWVWDVAGEGYAFAMGYDDYPCETTLWAVNAESDAAITRLFAKLSDASFGQ